MTISRVENACKPLILLGLQKNIKIISTLLLTVLTYMCYIITRTKEERKIRKKKIFILRNVLTTTAKAVYIKTVRFPHRGNKVC